MATGCCSMSSIQQLLHTVWHADKGDCDAKNAYDKTPESYDVWHIKFFYWRQHDCLCTLNTFCTASVMKGPKTRTSPCLVCSKRHLSFSTLTQHVQQHAHDNATRGQYIAVLGITEDSNQGTDRGLVVGVPWHGWSCQPGRHCLLQAAASGVAGLQMLSAEPEHWQAAYPLPTCLSVSMYSPIQSINESSITQSINHSFGNSSIHPLTDRCLC